MAVTASTGAAARVRVTRLALGDSVHVLPHYGWVVFRIRLKSACCLDGECSQNGYEIQA